MNLYHLRYFVTLAKLEHYTKAAEELCITQPSLSHAISLLEKELGVTLFQKEGRNIVLTKCGKIFLEKVKESLKILDDSVLELKSISNGEGYIDLGFLRTLGTNFVPRLSKSYIENNPDKKINFNFHTETTTADLIKSLKEQKYDMIFCSKSEKEKKQQNMFFFWYKREFREQIMTLLRRIHRADLIPKLYGKEREK